MAMDRINRKLDLIMEKLGVDTSEFDPKPAPERKLTKAEQQAIDNAPKTPVAQESMDAARTTETGAPSTKSSTPPVPAVPKDAVGSVTVETKQPDGDTTVKTMPAEQAKKK